MLFGPNSSQETHVSPQSCWKQVSLPQFSPVRESIKVDIVIVGGGNTGIVTAYLLKQAGHRVALIERGRCAHGSTGNTTAHLTSVTDLGLTQLVRSHGLAGARAVWEAGVAAIDKIQEIITTEKIECEFERVPGYIHSSIRGDHDETSRLHREVELAQELGVSAEFVNPVPIFGREGIRVPDQAKFHPLKYLAALVACIPGDGSYVFEQSEARMFDGANRDFVRVQVNGHLITCQQVVIATDVPLSGLSNLASATLLQTKFSPYTSYVIGAKLPPNTAPAALFWDTSRPYYYLRVDHHLLEDYVIFGGNDHKTGQAERTSDNFVDLETTLHRFLPTACVDRRWSGQVLESHDGLPLIGQVVQRQFVATGFSGNGLTFGTLAGMMIRDALMGRKNPWHDLFSPHRLQLRGGIWNYLSENLDYPYYLLKDRLMPSENRGVENVNPGQGTVLKLNGQRVAVYRNEEGQTTKLSAVCTHMGCIVHWNEAESSWDCPCHGARFDVTGKVIAGPAEKPLQRVD